MDEDDDYSGLEGGLEARLAYIEAAHHQFEKDDARKLQKAQEAQKKYSRAKYEAALSLPFNVFNPRKTDYTPSSEFQYHGSEFAGGEPVSAPSPGRENAKATSADLLASGSHRAHGLHVHIKGHQNPPALYGGRKCQYPVRVWKKQAGTEVCIFCGSKWKGAQRCPYCEAVACESCLEDIRRLERKN